MPRNPIVAFALLAGLGALAQVNEKEPAWALKFSDFAVLESFHGKTAKPILTTRSQRTFRSAITQAAAKGPNFAGHYTIAEWGCGSGCMSVAVVDAASGKVFSGPFKILSIPMAEGEGGHEYQGTVYQLKSRLFIADGCPQEANCGTYYYEWNQDKFKQLRFDPASARK